MLPPLCTGVSAALPYNRTTEGVCPVYQHERWSSYLGLEESAAVASALFTVFAHREGYVFAFLSPSTQQIESHDAHILRDLWEKSVMMQLSGNTWQTSGTSWSSVQVRGATSNYFSCSIKGSLWLERSNIWLCK